MFYVYIIYSHKVKKKYTGQTENIELRIKQHNEGLLGNFTKNKGPWELIYVEEFSTRSAAMEREKFFKTGKGRDFIKEKTGY
jgi:putative endonuclease